MTKKIPARLGDRPEESKNQASKSSRNLVFAVVLVSLVTCFPVGHCISGMNGAQREVVNWIREITCARLGGEFGRHFPNASKASVNASTLNERTEVWCSHVEKRNEGKILKENPELNRVWAILTSVLYLGSAAGCLTVSTIVQYTGIKWSILVSSIIFAAGSAISACSTLVVAVEMLIVGRLIMGFGSGVLAVVVPVYITEVSPASVRGAAGTVPSAMYRLGFIFGSSLAFPSVFGNAVFWPVIIALQVVPAIGACVGLPFCPESPRHLFIERSEPDAAKKALQWLRRTRDVEEDMEELKKEKASAKETLGCVSFLRNAEMRREFWLCAIPGTSEAFCGFYAVMFYSTSIFNGLEMDQTKATAASIGLWCSGLVATLLSAILVEKMGRRRILELSYIGTLTTLVVLVVCLTLAEYGDEDANYGSLVCLLAYMFFFSIGAVSVPKILPGELFGEEARTTAMSLTQALNYATGLIVALLFPIIITVAKQYTYLIFVGLTLFLTVFVLCKVPETKGKELDTIQGELNAKH